MRRFIRRAVSVLMCIGMVLTTMPALAAGMRVVIDDVKVVRETDTVTVSGHVENYMKLFLKQYVTLSVTEASSGDLRNITQIEMDDGKNFEYSFVHNGKGGTEHCVVTAKLSGEDETAVAYYYVTGGSAYNLFSGCTAFAAGAQTYFKFGERTETLDIPFAENGDLYVPKKALAEKYDAVNAMSGTYVSFGELNNAGIAAYYNEASGIGTVGGEEIDSNSLAHSKGMFGVYVSPENGSDSNGGYFDAPVATIEKAVAIASAEEEKPIIYLCDELYRLNKIVEIKYKNNLAFKAYSGVTPEITKSVRIPAAAFTAATPEEAAAFSARIPENTLLCADLTDYIGTVGTRSRGDFIVYDDGIRAKNARWPNSGWENSVDVTGSAEYEKIGISAEKAALWGSGAANGFIEIYAKTMYSTNFGKITSVEPGRYNGKDISVATLNIKSTSYIQNGAFYTENIPAELDTAYEWYIDTDTNKLYYYPGENFSGIDITLPKQKSTVTTPGINSIGDAGIVVYDSRNISFEGISFRCINGDGISIVKSQNVDISDGKICGTGNSAVSMQASAECDIDNMIIYDTYSSGVDINNRVWSISTGYDRTLKHENNIISNCDISNVGVGNGMSSGINMYGCGNTVRNSIIHDINHQAIYMMGPEHTFENNDVHGACVKDADAGMIYIAGVNAQGTVVRSNAIHDQPAQAWYFAMYLDAAASGVTIENNYIHDISVDSENGGIWVNGGSDVTVKDNVIANIPHSVSGSIMPHGVNFHKIIVPPNGPTYKTLNAIYGANSSYGDIWKTKYPHLYKLYTDIKENIIVNEETGEHTCSDTSIGKMKNFTVTGNVIAACEKPGNRGVFSITKEIAQEETNVVPNLAYGSNVTPSVEGFEDNVNLTYSEYMANKESYLAKLNLAEMGVPSAEVEESVFAPKVGFPYDGGIYDSIGEINWSKAPGADKYHITLSKNADLSDPVAEKETIYTTLKIADALEDGTYYYRIDGIRKSNNLSRTDTGEVRSFKISDAKAYASSGSLNALPCDGSVKIELPQKYSGITADLIKLKDKDGAEIEANIEVKDNAATVSGKNMLAPEHSYVIEINHSTYPISVSFKTAKKISVTKTTGDELLNVTVKSMLEKNQLSYNAFYAESDSNGKLLNVRQSGQKTLEAGMEKTEQFSFLKDSALGMLYIWDKQMPLTDKIKIK